MAALKNFIRIPYSILITFYLIGSSILRVILWIEYGIQEQVRLKHLPSILTVGAVQDIIALLFILFPISLISLLPDKFLYNRIINIFGGFGFFLFIFGTLFLLPAEYLFFDEFTSRFNLVAVDYFAYPTEVFGNIWESYPIIWIFLIILILSITVWKLIWKKDRNLPSNSIPWYLRVKLFFVHFFLIIIFLYWGSIDLFIDQRNRIESQISRNGILTFFEALYTNNIEFDHFYTVIDKNLAFEKMRKILSAKGGEFVSNDIYNLTRKFPSKPDGLGKLNIVIIGEESLGAQYISALGDPRNLTPNFDRLSQEGLLFENAFATGTRTVRGLEAISMSFPPIPSESTVKRPNNEGMANLGQLLNQNGYTSSFLYGGFGIFDNMNYFFKNNGFNISDRLNVDQVTFSNIWGICDEDLFRHAISYFDKLAQNDQPFFSIIMSTSNHKPFTFRGGIPNIPESGGGREAGVRYADFALGKFFDEAKQKAWFKNTIFLVVGDHDSRVYGKAQLPVDRFRVAMMILAPEHIKAQRIRNVTSHIDIAPTLMGLLGLEYQAPFYGRDILDPNAPLNQAVLLNHNHDVGLFHNGELAITGLNKTISTFIYTEDKKTLTSTPNLELQEDLTAYLQSAYQLYKDKSYRLN